MSPSDHYEHWKRGWDNELNYWRYILSDMGKKEGVEADTRARLDPNAPLQENFRNLATDIGKTSKLRILDVGAGVLTHIGKVWDNCDVQITAIDPLAAAYDELLSDVGIEPIVRTIEGQAENLPQQFPRQRFDIVVANNALDHSADAPACIKGMWQVVVKGGVMVLSHAINEAETHRYQGMHCWNFYVDEGDEVAAPSLMVSDNETVTSVIELLGDNAQLVALTVVPAPNKPGWVTAVYRKPA